VSIDPALLNGPYDCVFDVGADRGDFARACLSEWPGCTVESFEPLRELVNLSDEGPWRWHHVALAQMTGAVPMFRNEFTPSSSILAMTDLHRQAFPYTARADEIVVECRRLDEYTDRIRGRALLKLDVQGYESHVLEGAGDALTRFAAVVLEVSHVELYAGAPMPEQLALRLRATGFTHRASVDVLRHPVTHQILQTDELWEAR
jgi:FkbM family methyltransferase